MAVRPCHQLDWPPVPCMPGSQYCAGGQLADASVCVMMQAAAASALLLHNGAQEGDGAPAPAAAAEVLELGPALYKVARVRPWWCCLLTVPALCCWRPTRLVAQMAHRG